jgi:glycosyltransferase involved in cell wall biosynthesis
MKLTYSIVQITGDSTASGVPRHVTILAQELKKRGHRVTVICPPGPLVKRLEALRVKTEVIAMGSPLDRRADHKIRAVLARVRPDVTHCHGLRGGWLGRLAARKLKNIAIVYTEHLWTKDYHLANRVWEEFQIRGLGIMDKFTDMTIAVSGAVKNFLLSHNIVPDRQVIVIPNMLDPDFIGLKKYHKPAGVPQIIGSIGSLNIQKGYLVLLKALKILEEKKLPVDWRCQLIGAGPLEKTMRKRIEKYRLAPKVSLKLSTDSVAEAMRHFSCYVQNSRTESFGLAVIEAMSLGVPVITTNRGALPEIVCNKETGLIVPYGQPEKLAQAMAKILTDRRLAEDLGENGCRAALKKFATKPIVDRIEKIYHKAIRNRQFKRDLHAQKITKP